MKSICAVTLLPIVSFACLPPPPVEARVPIVDEPVCVLPEQGPTPGIVERTPLSATVGCNTSFVSTRDDVIVTARRADGSIDESNFTVEKRVTAFEVEGMCEIHVHTTAWERKLDDLLEVEPFAARVTLCGARVTTAYADALSSATPELRKLEVGVNPDDAPAELTTLVGSPRPMPVEDASVEVECVAASASAEVERYAFHHLVVVRMTKEDALRLAWDGTIETSFDVLIDPT